MSDDKAAFSIPVTPELMADANLARHAYEAMDRMIYEAFDRTVRPWKYAHRNPMPTFVPFPRVDRVILRARLLRERVSAAVDVLRYGPPHHDEDDW